MIRTLNDEDLDKWVANTRLLYSSDAYDRNRLIQFYMRLSALGYKYEIEVNHRKVFATDSKYEALSYYNKIVGG